MVSSLNCKTVLGISTIMSLTFSQLLVKAHRNEEEETTSRVVGKNMMVQDDTTLGQ